MQFIGQFSNLKLDIVGIVAILGEGSTSRNAQASALSWHHILPRLYPAPQALLRHHQQKRLPVEAGVVVGALSGRIQTGLNFFTQLLHHEDLPEFAVQLLEVKRLESSNDKIRFQPPRPAFGVKKFGHLASLSILGCSMAITLLALSIWLRDGPALMATICLSFTSTFVGLASWCELDVKEEKPNEKRKGKVPLGDVIIFYPRTGAFRVIRCTDQVSRFYFRVENCNHYGGDNFYRTIALISTVLLMSGLIMLSNSQPIMQAAFAASYVLLNVLYWVSSALNPATHVWKHDFSVKEIQVTQRIRAHNPTGLLVPANKDLPSLKAGLVISSETATIIGRTRQYRRDEPQRVTTFHMVARVTDSNSLVGSTESDLSRILRHLSRLFASQKSSDILDGSKDDSTRPQILQGSSRSKFDIELNKGLLFRATYSPNMTSALWTAIALTGRSKWARTAHIAPDHEVWDQWLEQALKRASPRWSHERQIYVPPCMQVQDSQGNIWVQLPTWNFQEALSAMFVEYAETTKQKYSRRHSLPGMTIYVDEAWDEHKKAFRHRVAPSVIRRLRAWLKGIRLKRAGRSSSHVSQVEVVEIKS